MVALFEVSNSRRALPPNARGGTRRTSSRGPFSDIDLRVRHVEDRDGGSSCGALPMDFTAHAVTLISIVIGIGLTEMFGNLHRLIRNRTRVTWDWLPGRCQSKRTDWRVHHGRLA